MLGQLLVPEGEERARRRARIRGAVPAGFDEALGPHEAVVMVAGQILKRFVAFHRHDEQAGDGKAQR